MMKMFIVHDDDEKDNDDVDDDNADDLRRFAAHAVKSLTLLQVHLLLGSASYFQGPGCC